MDIRSAYTNRLGSTLGAENPSAQPAPTPAGQVQPPPVQRTAPVQPMPSIPEELGIDRRAWATYSPALRQALLVGKLPDLNPAGITAIIVQFDRCAPDRGFPPPEYGNPGAPSGPPPMQGNPGAPGGTPPSSDNPGAQNGPPPTAQTVGVQQPAPPMTQQAFVAPGGMIYVQAFAAPGGPSLGYYQLPQTGYPTGIQPAGQAAPGSGPQYPPMLGWFVLGGALLVTAWMLWEITKMKSQLQHGKR